MKTTQPSSAPDRRTPVRLRLKRSRRFKAGIALVTFAILMAVVHFLEHAGAFKLTNSGLDDLLFGWPAAAVIAVAGLIVMGT
ncbi:hypothetical protein ACIQWA_06780 [Kitasatospora sp. NPDC098652]|uniref:hypothetical protein n=1 Tax=Kitasatospora sp. NPDC098652 TaxID=3364095 RepID=UPI0037FB79FD